jgi:hypothetical protein
MTTTSRPATTARGGDRMEPDDERFAIRFSIHRSARKHGVVADGMRHAIEHALAVGEADDSKGPLPRP